MEKSRARNAAGFCSGDVFPMSESRFSAVLPVSAPSEDVDARNSLPFQGQTIATSFGDGTSGERDSFQRAHPEKFPRPLPPLHPLSLSPFHPFSLSLSFTLSLPPLPGTAARSGIRCRQWMPPGDPVDLELFGIVLCLFGSGFFSASETALTSLPITRLEALRTSSGRLTRAGLDTVGHRSSESPDHDPRRQQPRQRAGFGTGHHHRLPSFGTGRPCRRGRIDDPRHPDLRRDHSQDPGPTARRVDLPPGGADSVRPGLGSDTGQPRFSVFSPDSSREARGPSCRLPKRTWSSCSVLPTATPSCLAIQG